MNIEIANRLVDLRKRNGLSQEALAQELGISRQAVSKWERAESSPDTDNLILLAKLYGVSLDDILKLSDEEVEELKDTKSEEEKNDDDVNDETNTNRKKGVNIGWEGIHVVDGEDEVHIDWNGVHVVEGDEEVHVSGDGVYVNGEKKQGHMFWCDDKDDAYYDEKSGEYKWGRKRTILDYFPYALIAIVVFLYLGIIDGVWHPTWLVLFTIPIYDSISTVIRKRKLVAFNYPLVTFVIFFYIGFQYQIWSPTWAIFITIPIFYYLVNYFRKFRRR